MRDRQHQAQIVCSKERPALAVVDADGAQRPPLPHQRHIHAGLDPVQKLALTGIDALAPNEALAPRHSPRRQGHADRRPSRRYMRLQQELSALRIFQQQSAPAGGRNNRDEPLDDRLKQGVEFGFLAEPQRQLVEKRESLCPRRIDRLSGLEHGCRCIDHCVDVETRVVGGDEGSVIRAETRVETCLTDRDLYLDRRVADADRLAGSSRSLPLPLICSPSSSVPLALPRSSIQY